MLLEVFLSISLLLLQLPCCQSSLNETPREERGPSVTEQGLPERSLDNPGCPACECQNLEEGPGTWNDCLTKLRAREFLDIGWRSALFHCCARPFSMDLS
ncbi:unnamed protein product [Prorocentrum cordatum]|uniref:Phospholipid scramblase n=1 Tax=Prorocentrum cordatum TaxID=2364126 RepID=A0ABN9W5P5_9DINO|nr:unnamed protein product [Polarella glacialis]